MNDNIYIEDDMKDGVKMFMILIGVISIIDIMFIILTVTGSILRTWTSFETIIVIAYLFLLDCFCAYGCIYSYVYKIFFYSNDFEIKTMFSRNKINYDMIRNISIKRYTKRSQYYLLRLLVEKKEMIITTKKKDEIIEFLNMKVKYK